MSNIAPAIVEIEFNTSSTLLNFVLNDAVKGVLNNTTYKLGGVVFVDVTNRAYSTSITRGKNQALARYNAGTCTVVLDNERAEFDPTIPGPPSTQYPYAGQIIPGRRMRVTVGTELIFFGVVQDWDLNYPLDQRATAIVKGADAFSQIANRTLATTTFGTNLSSAMLSAVLDTAEVAFDPALRDIQTGVTTLQSTSVTVGQNALTYLQQIESSEPGALFVSKDGFLTFRSRRYNPVYSGAITITDDGTSITPRSIGVEFGSELLYNRASITRTGGTTQVTNNATSQASYGIFAYNEEGMLMSTDTVALSFSQYYANTFSQPVFRPRVVSIDMAAQTGNNQGLVAALDIDDLVLIKFTPPGGQLISKYMNISGIKHRISPASHILDFDLIDAAEQSLIYGDAAISPSLQPLSLLDSNRYGF
jgi:hypothetical protein